MDNYIIEKETKTPVIDSADVVVVGGGPSGLAAAIAAARMGAKTILIERYGCFGGNITVANVEPLNWYRQPMTADAGGIGMEYDLRMSGIENGTSLCNHQPGIGLAYNTELFKKLADEMIEEAGVIPYLHCYGTFPYIVDDNQVKGIITESKSGRNVILAKQVVDCTGDADIAARAGAPYRIGGKNGELMGVTLCFGVNNVDVEKVKNYMAENPQCLDSHALTGFLEPFIKAQKNGEWREGYSTRLGYFTLTEHGEARGINHASMGGIDASNMRDLTRAEIFLRKHVVDSIWVLRKYMPGFENCILRTYAMSVGVRETRRITSDYSITFSDIVNEAQFEDSIGIFPVYMDALDVYPKVILPESGACFQIPYRCLVPQNVENLLVAGRSISAEREAIGTVRQMNCCAVTGQAAGIAASLCAKQMVSPRDLDIAELQKAIKHQGVRIS
ncbi:MAG: FAD-dependent oxidoreductase [Ruminiclostridium sp.]